MQNSSYHCGRYVSYGFAKLLRKVLTAYGNGPCNINVSLETVSVMIAVFVQIFSAKLTKWLCQVTQKNLSYSFPPSTDSLSFLTQPSWT